MNESKARTESTNRNKSQMNDGHVNSQDFESSYIIRRIITKMKIEGETDKGIY